MSFKSRELRIAELAYPVHEKECVAAVQALKNGDNICMESHLWRSEICFCSNGSLVYRIFEIDLPYGFSRYRISIQMSLTLKDRQ